MAQTLQEARVEPAAVLRRAPRARLAARLADLPVAVWLTGLITLSACIRFVFAWWVPAPWILPDELKYSELAKSFASTGHFAIRDVPGLGLGPLYPLVISPAYAVSNLPDAYLVVKAINSVLMSLAAIPTYLLARRLLPRSWSLVAAALALAVPSTVYAGTIMTENLFYPLFLAAALGILSALDRPSARRQLVALALIALALLTRAQAAALLAAFVTAIVTVAAADVRDERLRLRAFLRGLRRYLTTWIALGAGFAGLVGWAILHGRSTVSVAGDSQNLLRQQYSIGEVTRWFFYHLAELDLYAGVLPFAAFLILMTFAFSRADRTLRIFALGSLSIIFWLLLTVAAFTSGLTKYDPNAASHVEDRYTFYVVPLLVIALCAWVSQRVPSSTRKAAVTAVLAGGLVLALPYEDLIRDNVVPDAVAFLPWVVNPHGAVVARPHIVALVALVMFSLAGLFFLLRPPRLPRLAPLLVLLYFGSMLLIAENWYHVEGTAAATARPDKAWIDHAVGPKTEVVAIWSGRIAPHLILENEFFNRSVGRVYYLRGPTWAGIPEEKLIASPRSGVLVDPAGRPLRARFALVDPWVVLRGRVIARDRTSGMRLYRLNGHTAQISAQ
jgi:hypothetical protein